MNATNAGRMPTLLSFYLGRRGVSRSGGNCISAAAAALLFCAMLFGCRAERAAGAHASCVHGAASVPRNLPSWHPARMPDVPHAGSVRSHARAPSRVDFVTPNPDVAETASALKTALNL